MGFGLPSPPDERHGRMLACLLGGALGDAMGYEVEFMELAAIRARFGPRGITEPVDCDGLLLVSDDTQMTLFTLEGLLRVPPGSAPPDAVLASVRQGYLDWLDTQRARGPGNSDPATLLGCPTLYARRAPGNTCLSALLQGGEGTPERPINESKGCGGVMRIAPVAFWPEQLDADAAFDLGARCAALTHGHPEGWLSAGWLAALLRELIAGASMDDAFAAAQAALERRRPASLVSSCVTAARDLAGRGDHEAALRSLGQGWVGEEALAVGLYAALSAQNFEEALIIAANHDGDSDSTASIAGQIWGAAHGPDGLPSAWVEGLDVLDPLLRLFGALCAGREAKA